VRSTVTCYDIQEIASSGAYGVICFATDPHGHQVAIKVLHLDQASRTGLLRRARDEARMLSRLDHPNLVRVEPVIEVNGRPALVMELVRGVSVDRLVRERQNRLDASVAVAIVRAVARGLDAAWSTPYGSLNHPMRIVHRDVKPGNIMISVEGTVKLVDFGLAKGSFEDREAESQEFVPGSRGYMAPERYDGEDTPKGDVYALGLSLFELVSGRKAVLSMRMEKHDLETARVAPQLASDLGDAATEGLRALFVACCQYDAERRPWPVELAAMADLWLTTYGEPDLGGFAAEVVAPLYHGRPKVPPGQHPMWAEVRFLEGDVTGEHRKVDVTAELRRAVTSKDFAQRAPELAALLASHPDVDVSPLLAVLDESDVPAWQFWRRPVPAERTVAALTALGPLCQSELRNRIMRLASHRDPLVARKAREILDGAS